MDKNTLAKLLEQRELLNARIRREEAKRKVQQRKSDTRRKILAGAAVLDRAAGDVAFKGELDVLLDKFLVRGDDRALFGLAPLTKSAVPAADTASDEMQERNAA